jgi:hypothetical protein
MNERNMYEVAERMGMDRSCIAEVETGKIEICLRNPESWLQTFDMELYQLMRFPKGD